MWVSTRSFVAETARGMGTGKEPPPTKMNLLFLKYGIAYCQPREVLFYSSLVDFSHNHLKNVSLLYPYFVKPNV